MADTDSDLRIRPVAATVREQLVQRLKRALFARRFLPGQRLPERELCELTGASRTALREALRQLEGEGLIEIVPHKGPSVARITGPVADEIYAVREPLEGLLAALAAARAGPADSTALRANTAQLEVAFADRSTEAIVAAKSAFYDILFRLADNAELQTVLSRLIGRLGLIWPTMIVESGEAAASLSELSVVVDAIAAADTAAAEAAMVAHIHSARRLTAAYFQRAAEGQKETRR